MICKNHHVILHDSVTSDLYQTVYLVIAVLYRHLTQYNWPITTNMENGMELLFLVLRMLTFNRCWRLESSKVASFGRGKETVTDKSYRDAYVLEPDQFLSSFQH